MKQDENKISEKAAKRMRAAVGLLTLVREMIMHEDVDIEGEAALAGTNAGWIRCALQMALRDAGHSEKLECEDVQSVARATSEAMSTNFEVQGCPECGTVEIVSYIDDIPTCPECDGSGVLFGCEACWSTGFPVTKLKQGPWRKVRTSLRKAFLVKQEHRECPGCMKFFNFAHEGHECQGEPSRG